MFPTIGEQLVMPALASGASIAAIAVIVLTRGRLGYRDEPLRGVGKVDEAILVRPDNSLQA
jgi:hypothetical protein